MSRATDLSKVIIKAVRELGERDGSNLKNIEKYVRQSHNVEEEQEGDLRTALRLSAKRAVDRGLVLQEGRLFRQPDRPIHLAKKCNAEQAHNDSLTPKVSESERSFYFSSPSPSFFSSCPFFLFLCSLCPGETGLRSEKAIKVNCREDAFWANDSERAQLWLE